MSLAVDAAQPSTRPIYVQPSPYPWWPATPQSSRPTIATRPPGGAYSAPRYLHFDGRYALVPATFHPVIHHAVHAGNRLQTKPYRHGGGHKRLEDSAYDCSGSVSYVLIRAGLLRSPLSSDTFARYGHPGPGRFITIYVKPGEHVFMTICGLRFDTTGGHESEGPRWRPQPRSTEGFILRDPPGL